MRHRIVTLSTLFVLTASAQAEDKLYTTASKNKAAYTAYVKEESPRGVKLDGVKQEILAGDIVDIIYHLEPTMLRLNYYNPAQADEKAALASTDEKKRAKLIADAVQKYEDTRLQIKDDKPFAKRHLEFKVASLYALLAQDDGDNKSIELAISHLRDFKMKYPQSWQLTACSLQLGQLLVARGDYDEAEQVYLDLAKAKVADATRQDAELQGLQVSMKAGQILLKQGKQAEAEKRFAAAENKLQALAGALPKGSAQQVRVQLALAECLGAAKKMPAAQKLVKEVLAGTKKEDKTGKARAYNALGYCYYLNEQWQEARWQFLWVDAVYNQDKFEHSKALYYLADIFQRLGETKHAKECLDTLRNDRNFAGLEYQRRAQRELKAP